MKIKKLVIILFVSIWILAACSPAATSIPATSTNTAFPTQTPVPTRTPIPPTPTIIPPAVLSQFLENPKVISIDGSNIGIGWNSGPEVIKDGYMELVGKDWTGFDYANNFHEGEGILVNFKYTRGADFEMYFDNGSFQTKEYKRYGVYLSGGYAESNRWNGKNLTGNYLRGNFYPQPDTWYSLLLTIGKNGDFFAHIWDPANPDKIIKDRQEIADWEGLPWRLAFGANEGTIQWDQFTIIKFDNVK